ncbi:GMC family oxidoreductase N-terminal domain-containing protein [Aquimarina atlantica]|uniref:GMC family oxidoreductase N-terminal domain-containing protein n=1 Tax=Aquimarina atlantica TaxID=1317122 RepID=UPI000553A7F6|nr:GMC family oxidoreductase N-terminal domain-containing protein [Aquimarina atlantica]
MKYSNREEHFDAIIVGSGTCGATIAKELSKQNKRVLILERGGNGPLKESLIGYAKISNEIRVTNKLKDLRAFTTGGTTAMYFAVADPPPIKTFQNMGIDLTQDLENVRKELPVAEISDELIGSQAKKLGESARQLGYEWKKNLMLIDQSKFNHKNYYEVKWKARTYVEEALKNGAKLTNQATVEKVIYENNKAVGVEYTIGKKKKIFRVYGEKIVLSAGSLATPIILKNSGIKNVVDHGFYINPSIGLIGSVPGLSSGENFCGCMGGRLDNDIELMDANFHRFLFNVGMLVSAKPLRIASYPKHIGITVKVKEPLGGQLTEKGKYLKKLTEEDHRKLKKGMEVAHEILKNTGARKIFKTNLISGGALGTVKIKKHIDENLQTEYNNLYVCDGSVLPESDRVTPTLTLVCLAKYLSRHLIAS